MTKNVSNLIKDINPHVQEAQQTSSRLNTKRSTLRHILIKLSKPTTKRKIFKVAREMQLIMYRGSPTKLTANFACEPRNPEGSGMTYLKC